MDASIDAAQSGLRLSIAVAVKAARDAWQHVGCYLEVMLIPVKGGQDDRGDGAPHAMRSWIGGIGWGGRQRVPVGVRNRLWIAVGVSQADGRDRPPDLVVVLGFVESD